MKDLIITAALIVAGLAGYAVGSRVNPHLVVPLTEQDKLDLYGSLPQPVDWKVYEAEGRVCILATEPPLVGCGPTLTDAVFSAKLALLEDDGRMGLVWSAR